MITQSINLYLPEFQRKKDWLTAQRSVQIVSLVIALLLNISALSYWSSYRIGSDLAMLEKQRQEAVANTQKVTNLAGSRTADEGLKTRNLALEDMLERKLVLLNFMQGKAMGNAAGFSSYLADLSRYHTPGLSLSTIALLKGGNEVVLGGQVLRAELVPQYLQNLSQGTSFSGKSFTTFAIDEVLTQTSGYEQTARLNPTTHLWQFAVSTGHQE